MEIGQYPVSSCSKEHQKIYQEWFALADSGPIHPLLCSPPIPNPPLLLLLAWVVVCSNRRCCRWGWPHHGPRRHQVLRHVQALPPRPQAGAAYRCDPSPPSCFVCLAGGAIGFSFPHVPFLSNCVAIKVWAIADSRRQGYLGFPEFVAAMQVCLVYSMLLRSLLLPGDLGYCSSVMGFLSIGS